MMQIEEGQLTQFDQKALGVLESAKAITIKDDNDYDRAGRFLTGLKTYQKELDATFDPIMKAQRLALQTSREAKDRHAQPINEAEAIVKDKLSEHRQKRELEIQESNRKAMEAEAKSKKAIIPQPAPELPKLAGVSYRKDWVAEVVDLDALIKAVASGSVPSHFLEPVIGEIKKFGSATKGKVPVPGVKFSQKDVVAGRAY